MRQALAARMGRDCPEGEWLCTLNRGKLSRSPI
jgi:hypothetical protein